MNDSIRPASDPRSRPAPGDSPPALVRVAGVSKRYGATQALRDVSVDVHSGRSHALVGRNGAGKSTLVKILTGLEVPDTGVVEFEGVPAPPIARRREWAGNVACVHQRSMIVPDLSVLENLMLDRIAQGGSRVHWRPMRREAVELMDEWDLRIPLDAPARDLTVGERQLLEIARSLRGGSRFIVMDEPTSQLQAREIEVLFGHMDRLKRDGVTFLYISHHLSEIFEVCDAATVLRDGRHIITTPIETLSRNDLVEAMVGATTLQAGGSPVAPQDTAGGVDDEHAPAGPIVLSVEGLTIAGAFRDVTLDVRRGERVGVAGIAGCGKVELAAAIAGLERPDAGNVAVEGRRPAPGRIDAAIREGISYVPEDRHHNGFCANLSIEENLTSTVLPRLSRWGLVSKSRRSQMASRLFEELDIKASSLAQLAGELSGGNQQKLRPRARVGLGPRGPRARYAYSRHRCRGQGTDLRPRPSTGVRRPDRLRRSGGVGPVRPGAGHVRR
ncbi:MAG: sugar ABC transporter ATP-binding protein [Nocardioides sp.]|uniref:sugar ABC transporter ATP-binding protein n=1 Tax=Nocardioides sp. TaxID=35761 RepID=UPI0039E3CF19